ncbi:MAG: cupin domain-containing protein [Chthoniobacteraceae bacterium]|nr:cupin domain-containing protein [Chthoniobacteraceae bacterium]
MIIADVNTQPGRKFPARRWGRNIAGGPSPIQAKNFQSGYIVLEPNGGQVPWHNQVQEEVYFIVEGEAEICLGEERQILKAGQAAYIPTGVYHQLSNNLKDKPTTFIYIYGPAGDVAHWHQELDGTLPKAGVEAPALPAGSYPQCTDKPQA